MRDPGRERRLRHHAIHRRHLLQCEKHKRRARQIEARKHIEIDLKPERTGQRGRHQPSEQIARDIARHIGRKRARNLAGAVLFRKISHRQRERRRHEHALRDAQRRERRQIRHLRKQRRGNRKQGEADPNTVAPVDLGGQERHHDPGCRHAERTGVDRKPHLRRRDAVGLRQRRQYRLRREQVDERQETDDADHDQAKRQRGGGCGCHRLCRGGWHGIGLSLRS